MNGTVSGHDLADGPVQCLDVDADWIEVVRSSAVHLLVPLHQVAVAGSFGVSECVDKLCIALDPAAVLRRCRAFTVDHASRWRARGGFNDLLERQYVLPVVAEVVHVVESVPRGREDLAKTHLALTLRSGGSAGCAAAEVGGTPVVPHAIRSAELVQVASLPLEGCLENCVQLVQP